MSSPRVCPPASRIPPNNPGVKHFDSVVISQEIFLKNSKAEPAFRTWMVIFGERGSITKPET